MNPIISKLIGSFDNKKDNGFSARKLTAFSLMICIAYIHYKYVSESNAVDVLIIDLCGVSIMLGVITIQNVIELKNGGKNEPTN